MRLVGRRPGGYYTGVRLRPRLEKVTMRRREVLAAVAAGSSLLSGCIWGENGETTATPDDERPADNETTDEFEEPASNTSERSPSLIQSVAVPRLT